MELCKTNEDWGWFIDIDSPLSLSSSSSSSSSSYSSSASLSSSSQYIYKTQRKRRIPIFHTMETIRECPTELHEEQHNNAVIKCSVTKKVCFYGEPRVLSFIGILLVLSIVEIFLI